MHQKAKHQMKMTDATIMPFVFVFAIIAAIVLSLFFAIAIYLRAFVMLIVMLYECVVSTASRRRLVT